MADVNGVKIKPTSPYYVGQSDKPGDLITSVRLTLNNFDNWAYSVRTALKARRKYGFLNGTLNEPKPPCTPEDWETVHSLLVSWLMNTIDPEVKSLLPNYEDAKRLWDDLHERFSIIDGPKIQQIKSDLHDCRQTENMSVAVYYGKLCQLWDELDKYEPIITCKCRKCDCDIGKQYGERRDSDRLHQFLLGLLPTLYGSLRSILLSQTPLPTLHRVFNLISQEERVRESTRITPPANEVSSFVVRSNVGPHTASPRIPS